MAGNNAFQVAPWAYAGTDNTEGVALYPFITENSLPAMVVWLFLTTNSTYASGALSSAAIVTQIAVAVNLTENCVKSLLARYNSATRFTEEASVVKAAFGKVIEAFHSIGSMNHYPPDECPFIYDILRLAAPIQTLVPTQDNAAEAAFVKNGHRP